jgi:hypothetical protein
VTARLKLALVRPIVGLELSPPIVHDLETGARGDVLSEILRRVSGGGMGGRRGRQDRVVDGFGGTKRGHQALLDRVVDGLVRKRWNEEEMG